MVQKEGALTLDLDDRLRRRWRTNMAGGLRSRVGRWRQSPAIIATRVGIEMWASAPLFFGGSMRVHTSEGISRGILAFGYTELATTALMLRLVTPGMNVLDIGAHYGYISLLARRLAGPSGRVVAFEPLPRTFDVLVQNTVHHGVDARPFAVSDRVGKSAFTVPTLRDAAVASLDKSAARGTATVDVELVTLDGIDLPRRIHFIKCDAEGNELKILRGAARILTEDRPALVLEVGSPNDPHGSQLPGMVELLAPLGYRLTTFGYDEGLTLDTASPGHDNVAFLQPQHFARLRGG